MSAIRPVMVLASTVLLGVVGVVAIHSSRITGILIFCQLTILIIAVASIAVALSSRRVRALDLSFWSFVYVFLGIAGTYQLGRGAFPLGGRYLEEDIVLAQVIICVGLLAYMVGGAIGRRVLFRPPALRIDVPRAARVGFVVGLLGVAVLILLGGPRSFFTSRVEYYAMLSRVFPVTWIPLLQTLFSASPLVGLLVCVARRRHGTSPSIAWFGLVVVLSVIVFLTSSVWIVPRSWIGIAYLAPILYLIPNRKWGELVSALALIFGTLLALPAANAFRFGLGNSSGFRAATSDYLVTNGDFDALQQLVNAVAYVRTEGLVSTVQLVGPLLFFVPRDLWQAKPEGSGQLLAEFAEYEYTNLSAPLWAELYLSLGLVGVVCGFVALGLAFGVLQTWAEDAASASFIFLALLTPHVFLVLRGSMVAAITLLVPMLLAVLLATRRPLHESAYGQHHGERLLRGGAP